MIKRKPLPIAVRMFASLALLAAAQTARGEAPAPGDWGSFGIQTRYIDPAVRPGDDFDRYVNGKWTATATIPADRTRIGAFMDLRDLSEDRLRGILDELAATPQPPGSDTARIAGAYRAFMAKEAIDAAGLAPARPTLDRIAAAASLDDVIALFAAPGMASPIGYYIDPDEKRSDIYALHIGQDGLGLPDRDYYLSDKSNHAAIRAQYLDYLAFLLNSAGHENPRDAARQVMALETRLAGAMWDRSLLRNIDLTYNRIDMPGLSEIDGNGVMRRFLEVAGLDSSAYALVAQMPPTSQELAGAGITADPARLGGGMPATLAIVSDTPVETWKAWLTAHFLSDHAEFLPSDIDQARFALYGTALTGAKVQRERWRRGIAVVERQIGELLGKLYAERYFPPASKAAMADLVANLRKAMSANLADLAWMGEATRAQAEAKLASFTPKIGAPEVWKTYEGLAIRPDAALANQLAAERWANDFQRARIGRPVDRSEWGMLPETVNAYYNGSLNEIVFPAAILQPPFFNLSADPAVNYGAIGAVIGHEMGHGFDDQGAKMDGTGNLRDWWTAADKASFKQLQDRLAAQYDRFCPFDDTASGRGKACVNGQLTMGENIGDVGGLSLAYRAYRLSLGGKPAPVIDGYTGDQRFFMAWAQVWRGKVREELARQFLVTDPHAPPQYRINGVVRNFDAWYRAFAVKPGDALYLPPEQRVRIW